MPDESAMATPPRHPSAAAPPAYADLFQRNRAARLDHRTDGIKPSAPAQAEAGAAGAVDHARQTRTRPATQSDHMSIPRHVTMGRAWIKINADLRQRREVLQIARELGLEPDMVVGKLVAVWCWIDGETADGKLPGMTLADVDAVAEHAGFAAAMLHCKWLSETCGQTCGLFVNNFDRHMGRGGKRRAMEALRRAASRNGSN